MTISLHPTAIVDPGAQIGPGTRIWRWAYSLMAGVPALRWMSQHGERLDLPLNLREEA